jgi:hypothetical protein
VGAHWSAVAVSLRERSNQQASRLVGNEQGACAPCV